MRPLHINLLIFVAALCICGAAFLLFGRGPIFEGALTLYGIAWGFQFLLLSIAANARRAPLRYVSKFTFSLWAGAAYPLVFLSAPAGMFPWWFAIVSVPIGFLLALFMISVLLWMLTRLPRWPLPATLVSATTPPKDN